jgi:hypothetical protein
LLPASSSWIRRGATSSRARSEASAARATVSNLTTAPASCTRRSAGRLAAAIRQRSVHGILSARSTSGQRQSPTRAELSAD